MIPVYKSPLFGNIKGRAIRLTRLKFSILKGRFVICNWFIVVSVDRVPEFYKGRKILASCINTVRFDGEMYRLTNIGVTYLNVGISSKVIVS